MKLGYIYDACYPWETGGVQKRVWELSRRLAEDHDVHWFTRQYWEGSTVIEREGVTFHGVGEPGDLYVDGRRSIPDALSFAMRLVRPLLRAELDVIDCQEFPYFPVFSSRLHGWRRDSTLVLTWHEVWGDYWYEYLGRKGWFGKQTERFAAQLPDAHLAVSERTARDVRALSDAEATIVPNGISMAEIEAALTADRNVDVLFVGRLIPEKNAELLVRAARELDDVEDVLLMGEGPERWRLETLVGDLGLENRVELLDPREDFDEVLGLMKAAEVFALPSRREGFGITALEALACGTPVVTIAHPQNAIQELVEDGTTGAICEATPGRLAEGIRTARSCYPEDCVEAARGYEWDGIAEDIEAVYRTVADR